MSPIMVHPESLAQAANEWGALLSQYAPYTPKLAEQLGISNISVGPQDAASQAVVSATADWPGIYMARFNQREALAEKFVVACGGTAQLFTNADHTGANEISTAASSAAGPTLV